jgi:hypothetical protein
MGKLQLLLRFLHKFKMVQLKMDSSFQKKGMTVTLPLPPSGLPPPDVSFPPPTGPSPAPIPRPATTPLPTPASEDPSPGVQRGGRSKELRYAPCPPSSGLSPALTPRPTTTQLPSPASEDYPLGVVHSGRSKELRWLEDGGACASSTASLVQGDVGRKSYREALFSSKPAASRDVGGWVTVVRRRSSTLKSLPRPVPVDLRGRCFNSFSTEHRAAECRNRVRCFFCRLPGHHVGVCPRRRTDSPIPGRTLVWRPVAMKSTEKTVCGRVMAVAGGSGPAMTTVKARRRELVVDRGRGSRALGGSCLLRLPSAWIGR